ncbi:MAG: hypothetical protein K9M80_00920 [Candidatus Marinimicrobia bacterium]|nr:hypothetical protein [Candidatus Neomarinimicrobiota bacterium]
MLKKVMIFCFLITTTIFAKVYWYGYYETEFDNIGLPKEKLYTNYHKFRLDMDVSPSNNIRIAGNIIYKHFEGATKYNYMNFLDEYYHTLRLEDESPLFVGGTPMVINNRTYELKDTLFFDNIFLELHHKYFDLILGKQQLPTGSGYAWNPTDIFNKKDIFDPTYENRGVNALQLRIPIGTRYNLIGIIQPGKDYDNTTQYYEMKGWLGSFDVAFSYARTEYNPASVYELIGMSKNPAVIRDVGGFNMEGELLGLGLRTEIAVNRLNQDNDNLKYEYIIGADYTFRNSLYLLGEYYHNDFGSEVDQTRLIDYMHYFNYTVKSLNQNYAFGMLQYPLTDLIDISLSSIANLDDESIAINPRLVYRIYQDVELNFIGTYFYGEDNRDEFGYQDYMARVRLRAYF